MTIKKTILVGGLALLFSNVVNAQSLELSTFDADNNPILGVDIYVNNRSIGSNYDSEYLIEAYKNDTIYIRHEFYKERQIILDSDLFINNEAKLNIVLELKKDIFEEWILDKKD